MQKKSNKDYPMVLTVKEISALLNVSKPTAYQIMDRTNFPLIRFGRCKRVLREEFFKWLVNEGKGEVKTSK